MYANVAHYALHKFHKFPHELLNLDENERAFIMASISVKLKKDKEEAKKAKAGKRKR